MQTAVRQNAASAAIAQPTALPRNAVQAAVYRHILAWTPRARIVDREGRRWLVRTAAEFINTGKGLTWAPYTIRKALRGLAADGWIEVRHGPHPFGDREYQQHCTWIALTERSGKPNVAVPPPKLQVVAGGATFGATFDPPLEQHSTIISKKTYKEAEQAASLPAPHRPAALSEADEAGEGSLSNFNPISNPIFEEEPVGKTAAEVMAALAAAPKPKADLTKPLIPSRLHEEFKGAWLEAYPAEPVPPLSVTRGGQFKHLLAYAREQGSTDRQIAAMVRKIVLDWSGFVAFVAARGGPKMAEQRPSHAALLTHRDKAVSFARSQFSATAVASELEALFAPGMKHLKKKG